MGCWMPSISVKRVFMVGKMASEPESAGLYQQAGQAPDCQMPDAC